MLFDGPQKRQEIGKEAGHRVETTFCRSDKSRTKARSMLRHLVGSHQQGGGREVVASVLPARVGAVVVFDRSLWVDSDGLPPGPIEAT